MKYRIKNQKSKKQQSFLALILTMIMLFSSLLVNIKPVRADASAPAIISASTDRMGKKITLTFDRSMKDPSGTQDQFAVSITGGATTSMPVTSVALGSDEKQIQLNLSKSIAYSSSLNIALDYTKGSIEAEDGTFLDSFVSKPVSSSILSGLNIIDFDSTATEIGYDTSDPENPILKYQYDNLMDYNNVKLAWYFTNGFFRTFESNLANYVKFYEKNTGTVVDLPNEVTVGINPETGELTNRYMEITDWYFWQIQNRAPLGLDLKSTVLKPSTTYVIEIDKGFTFNNENKTTMTYYFEFTTKADPSNTATDINIDSPNNIIEIASTPVDEQFTSTVYDQSGNQLSGQNINWTVADNPIGISISNTGVLTVQPFASPGTITIKGTAIGTTVSSTKQVVIKEHAISSDVTTAAGISNDVVMTTSSSSIVAIDNQLLQEIKDKTMVLTNSNNVKLQLKPADLILGTSTLNDITQLQIGSISVDEATKTQLITDSTLSNLSGGTFSSAAVPFKLSAAAILSSDVQQITSFNNPVTVSIPVPSGLSLSDNQTLRACRFNTTTGKWEDKASAAISDGFITFDTSEFSYWTVMIKTVSSSGVGSGGNSGGSSSGSTTNPTSGNGTGIGFGVGIPKPLKYVGSYLTTITNDVSSTGASVDNSTSVPLLPTIKMVFDKNLANSVVWKQNKACFTLEDSSGETVPIDVFCIDDGMDFETGEITGEGNFEERRNVFIKPVSSLTPGETYKIIVSPKLLARNMGSVLSDTTNGKGVVVTFTTVKDGAVGATANTPSVSISVETKTDSNSNVVATVDSSKIKDNVINEIQIKEPKPESRIQVQIPVDAVKKGLAGFGINTDSVKLNIPAGVIDASSLSNGTILQISKNLMPTADAATLLANVPQGTKNIGKVFTFSMAVCDSNNNVINDIHNFAGDKSVAVTINLSSDDIKGMDTSKISGFYFDVDSKSWVDIGGSFDEKSMTYTFNTTHFTDFTIMEKSSALLENIKRLAGVDRIGTSIAIAKEQFKDKAPDAVVLTTANSFPDALSGEGLAYKYNAPMLLINKSVNESKNVLDYITSTLSKDKNIYILGGAGVVGDDVSDYLISQGYKVVRIAGNDRYETNQKIFDTLNVTTGTSIVLANGNGFADALGVSSIAALKGYPVLLSEKNNLSTNVINDIANIQPTNLYIIGGIGSLSADIEAQIKNMNGNINIVRLGGNDRYETSMKIAEYFNLDTDNITIASGSDFPDALSGAVLAARRNSGILLIDNTDTTRQKDLLNKRDVKNVIVFGGEGVISSDIANSLMEK
ncbi:cell wall-binding repeat-containing protein [Clostridium magnum]|uniref:N-acetylmuramoyl-L-alanine amidase LytC n=1 Tax=Clostridium magnum DSM 2767 TaxID=1121326 RepID=A0A162T609_9CLOT|nr:cell wall-binding repeat-containing protein [Clostridium magnum]KZL92280.1 N-acetylmuramoyl-L-alanine amidase LytC precursor [Clostridium magnum DSM 2767]SHH15067.1 Putative cell wall-binding protein [Clostridium magnum DSM 2767]